MSGGPSSTLELLNPGQRLFLDKAEMELTRRCMAAEGFDYALPAPDVEDYTPQFLTADQLSQGGYRLSVSESDKSGTGPNDEILAKLSPDQKRAWEAQLFGGIQENENVIRMQDIDGSVTAIATDGCLSTARKQLYGSLEGYLSESVVRNALSGSAVYNRLWGDASYQEVVDRWRSCMKKDGIDAGLGDDGRGLAEAAYLNSQPDAQEFERKVLKADIACLRATGLDTFRRDKVEEISRALVAEKGLNIGGAIAFDQQAVARARALIGEGDKS